MDGQIEEAASLFEEAPFTSDDLDRALAHAESLLDDLPTYWNRLEHQQRPSLLRAMFPGGLVCRNGSIGTAESPCFFYERSLPEHVEEGLVGPPGLEPGASSLSVVDDPRVRPLVVIGTCQPLL